MMLKSFKLTVPLLLASLLLATGSIAWGESPYADAYQAGQDYEKAGKFAEARAEYEKALAVEGVTTEQTGQALVKIGATYINEKKVQEGVAALQKARALKEISNPTRIEADLLFGQAYLAYPWVLNQSRDAFAEVLYLPEATPEQQTAARKGLVKALMGLKQFAEARSVMTALAASAALTPAEKLETQKSIATTYMLEGKYPEARAELAKVLSLEGVSEADKVDTQLQIALSYYEAQDYEHAKPELEKVLTMPAADATQVRVDGWANYVPSREAKLRLLKMNAGDEKEKAIAALFIGSSMTLRGYMPLVLEQLASSAPAGQPRMMNFMHARGGAKIDVFWNDGETRDTARGTIAAGPWDVVVLETFSNMSREDLLKYGKLFADFARSRNIRPVFYESQPIQALPYPEEALKYHEHIVELGKAANAPVAPVLLAEMRYLEAVPTAKREEFYDDWVHPSQKGIQLAAYCIYSAVTGYSPVGLSHPGNISDEDAKALQDAAWKAVQETNPDLKPWE